MDIFPACSNLLFSSYASIPPVLRRYQYPFQDQYLAQHYLSRPFYGRQSLSIENLYQTSRANMDSLDLTQLSLQPSQHPAIDNFTSECTPENIVFKTEASHDDIFSRVALLRDDSFLPDIDTCQLNETTKADTLEPKLLFREDKPYPGLEIGGCGIVGLPRLDWAYDAPVLDYDPTLCQQPVYQEHESLCNDNIIQLIEHDSSSPLYRHFDDDDNTTDKPYAKLIYEALMQAPGHKMMLRDIYEWFAENTTKPQDSGTNGWQNSIRHNLSMNQAFENDKNTPAAGKGHSRKANSVWMLTDDAIKNGVQSTTRYRKVSSAKKAPANRAPAYQRQRSGARGGRATRRSTARCRRAEEASHGTRDTPPIEGLTQPYSAPMVVDNSPPAQTPQYEYRPATPLSTGMFEPLYSLPPISCILDGNQQMSNEYNDFLDNDPFDDEYTFNLSTSPVCNGLAKP